MPTIKPLTQVKITELVDASRSTAEAEIAKANTDGNGYLSRTEAKALPADLQDNFDASQFRKSWGSVKPAELTREFTVMMSAFAKDSDKNGDGYLSTTEARSLPKSLRDNFTSYLDAQRALQTDGVPGAGGYSSRDVTPAGRAAAQLQQFGPSAVSYADALARALKAVATDEGGLASFVREFGGPDGEGLQDPAAVDAEVRTLLANGSVELVDADEDLPNGEDPSQAWVFSVWTDGQGDHGLWASVDRQTGETTVSSFN